MGVYLVIQQLLPWNRTCEVLHDVLGVHLSEGTLASLLARTAKYLEPIEAQTKTALSASPVIHQDETGLYVKNRRAWMHGTSTPQLTHYQVHESRGHEALDAIGILATFSGVSVHDCWATYFRYGCQHALCLVHLLRELTYLAEELGLWWAAKLKKLLLTMKSTTDQARAQGKQGLSPPEVADFTTRYLALLTEGDQVHPPIPTPKGKRGKAKQHPARNLLDRLRKHQEAVLLFLKRLDVPFDNNLAERDIRMVKVQQKVSGSFRSTEGASFFCCVRGYVSTLRKQGLQIFPALEATLRGQPLLPSFSET
jgi:transposase